MAKAAGVLGTSFAGTDAVLRARRAPGRYTGSFWPGGHAFSTGMQDEAARFLAESLQGSLSGYLSGSISGSLSAGAAPVPSPPASQDG